MEISTWRRWAGLAYKSATGDPTFLVQNMCDSSPFDHQSILMKDRFMETAKIVWNIPIVFTFLNKGAFKEPRRLSEGPL